MTDFLQYVIGQVKSKSLLKSEAIDILRQFEERNLLGTGTKYTQSV